MHWALPWPLGASLLFLQVLFFLFFFLKMFFPSSLSTTSLFKGFSLIPQQDPPKTCPKLLFTYF